ncbi:MAG: helix-turn-helix transcriptional regulator [Chloroflexota bacterium]
MGSLLKRARAVRGLSVAVAARAAAISPAYLSRLEGNSVKQPSPHVLNQLSEALGVPYAELMRMTGYRLPGEPQRPAKGAISAALFADVTDDERDELVAYLAWYRTRPRAGS